MTVSLIGGTGPLGKLVARELRGEGTEVIQVGRSAEGPGTARADLTTGAGLAEAIAGSATVIFLASSFADPEKVDVGGMARLLPLIDERHLIFISIVGVDRHPLPYYRAKFRVEQMIETSARRYSILRATQFHGFVASMVERMVRGPICLVPLGYRYQPVEISEVARALAEAALAEPRGRLPDFGGPEVLGVRHLARTYMTAVGRERPIVPMPRIGRVPAAFRRGVHTNPDRAVGTRTWQEYLDRLDSD